MQRKSSRGRKEKSGPKTSIDLTKEYEGEAAARVLRGVRRDHACMARLQPYLRRLAKHDRLKDDHFTKLEQHDQRIARRKRYVLRTKFSVMWSKLKADFEHTVIRPVAAWLESLADFRALERATVHRDADWFKRQAAALCQGADWFRQQAIAIESRDHRDNDKVQRARFDAAVLRRARQHRLLGNVTPKNVTRLAAVILAELKPRPVPVTVGISGGMSGLRALAGQIPKALVRIGGQAPDSGYQPKQSQRIIVKGCEFETERHARTAIAELLRWAYFDKPRRTPKKKLATVTEAVAPR